MRRSWPAWRSRTASSRSSTANPSASRRAPATRSNPWPYALALITASGRARGALRRATPKLLRRAERWIVARIGRAISPPCKKMASGARRRDGAAIPFVQGFSGFVV